MTEPANLSGMSPEDKRALLAELLRRKAQPSASEFPLSYGQRALWFVHQLDESSPAYNVAMTFRVRAPLSVEALRRAVQAIGDRHAVLRSTFKAVHGEPLQEGHASKAVPFDEVDAAGLDDRQLQALVVDRYRQPFDLEHGPLLRATVFQRSAEDFVVLLCVHHIAFDGESAGIVMGELRTLYAADVTGRPSSLPATEWEYADFINWQKRMLAASEGERLKTYWLSQLGGSLPVMSLPTDRPRPSVQSYNGSAVEFRVQPQVRQGLDALAREEGTSLFATLLAAYQVLLGRYADQDDVLVGVPSAGRSRAEFERIVGYFVNPLVMRANLTGNPPFRQHLRAVRDTVQAALAHADYPFPLLVEQLQPNRDPSRSPVFQVMFNLQRAQRVWGSQLSAADGSASELAIEPYAMPQEEGQFDLTLEITDVADTLAGALKYNSDLFDASTIARTTDRLSTLLQSVVADPDRPIMELSLLTAEESARVLREWNRTDVAVEHDQSVVARIEAQAARSPGALAVVCGDESLTYAELNARANRLARRLTAAGVGPGALVGIGLERSADMVVAVVAVLKSGGAYVPLDPAFPARRLATMIADAGLTALVTEQRCVGLYPDPHGACTVIVLDRDRADLAAEDSSNPPPVASETDLAYVIYTSGSTGHPKGVAVPRSALSNFLYAMADRPGLTASDVLLAVTTLSFDIAGLELLLPLTVGARVVIATRDDVVDGTRLSVLLHQSGATLLQATPATWRLLLQAGWNPVPGLRMLCGGEALSTDLAAQLLKPGCTLWNMYGPTETTIWSSVERVENTDGPPAIGRPIRNTRMYVLDRWRHPVPAGVRGELYIGGAGLARGYWRRADLTDERFLPDTLSGGAGARMYRTGDLAKHLPDGRIQCLGRIDDQVKVRGFRIELGDIESTLERHAAVKQAVAAVHQEGAGDRRLVAYVVHHTGQDATGSELRKFLRQELPDYMVPSLFVPIERVPLTANGKVDRRALPSPYEQNRRGSERVPPRTPAEEAVAEIWRQVLGTKDISVHDNFFEIGGHSLLSMKAIALIEEQMGVRIEPTRFVMDTLEQIAAVCERVSGSARLAASPHGAESRSLGLLPASKTRLLA